MVHIKHFTFNAFQTRCSLVWDEDGFCAAVDPGFADDKEKDRLTAFISANGLKMVCIMLTHAHFDHIYGVAELAKEFGIPVYMHEAEKYTMEVTNPYVCKAYGLPLPDISFQFIPAGEKADGKDVTDRIKVGSLCFEVIETPGHSKGGVCYLERETKVLFSGDTLFAGAIGRTDHPGGDYDQLIRNILEKLTVLEGEVSVIPGHGPCSDIATEGMTNPFLLPFNEPYED